MEDVNVITSNFSEGSDFQRMQLPIPLTIDYDPKVQLKSTGENFTISDFVSKKEDCNRGFLCNDSCNALKSYSKRKSDEHLQNQDKQIEKLN